MKAIKSLTLATLAFASVGTGYSQTTIRIVGSNGDRTATQTAISHLLTDWSFEGVSGSTTSTSPSTLDKATGANFGAWSGNFGEGNPVVIKVSYTGALAGIAAIAGNTNQRFVVSNGTGGGTLASPLGGTEGVTYELAKADFGLSTNFQSTSPFNGVYQTVTYSPVEEELVGVTPLAFYGSPGFPASAANITTQLAQQLYKSGSVSLQLFSGDTAHLHKIVWAIGRNTDAGQRFGAYTEIGLGRKAIVTVWKPAITGQLTSGSIKYGGTANTHELWPAETLNGIPSVIGSGGYSSGALLAEVLTTTLAPAAYQGAYTDPIDGPQLTYPDADGGYYVGYVTPGDGNTRIIPFGGVQLKYNGVELTDDNVKNGKYTAWVYNRILKPKDGRLTGGKLTFANALRDQVKNIDAPAGGGILLSDIKVERSVDGGTVTLIPPPTP